MYEIISVRYCTRIIHQYTKCFFANDVCAYHYNTLNLYSCCPSTHFCFALTIITFTLFCCTIFTFIARKKNNDIPIEMFFYLVRRSIARICRTHTLQLRRAYYTLCSFGTMRMSTIRWLSPYVQTVSFKSARVCLVKSNYRRSACGPASEVETI